jgi:CHAP domain
MGTGYCGGEVKWLRRPGTTGTGTGFARAAVDVARTQVGVREVVPNKGARVTEYQKSVRHDAIALGQPWCASFVTWVLLEAKDPTPYRSATVGDWVRMASAGRFGMSLVSQKNVRVGDLVVFKKHGGWQHMGIVSSVGGEILLISGNTTGKTRRAEGVYEKTVSNWTKLGYTAAYIRNDR